MLHNGALMRMMNTSLKAFSKRTSIYVAVDTYLEIYLNLCTYVYIHTYMNICIHYGALIKMMKTSLNAFCKGNLYTYICTYICIFVCF
jgi:hypothetical protein